MSEKDIVVDADNGENSGSNNGQSSTTTSTEWTWRDFRACLVTGAGFFMTAYDLFAMNLVSLMLAYVYRSKQNELTENEELGLKVSAQIGAIFGQLLFGSLADRYGRKRMYGLELMVSIGATISSILVGDSPTVSIIGSLIFYRFILGIGVGGDYPLSAVVTAEYFSNSEHRGKLMAVVFAQQGFGILCAALVSTSMLAAFRSSIDKNPNSLDYVWRLVLGFGAIPGLVALFFRLTISETPLYLLYVHNKRIQARENRQGTQNDQQEIDPDQENIHGICLTEFYRFFSQRGNRKYLKYLIGTCITWFCVDISFYGIGLNNATILKEIGFDVSKTSAGAYTQLLNASIGNVFITLIGTIPGYLMTIALIDNKNVGRIRIMYIGFAMSAVLLLIFGCAYKEIVNNRAGFIAMFVLIQFFQNFGPNSITFIISAELFPTEYRATAFGVSAAIGKLGAVMSQIGFSKLRDVGGKDPNNANEFLGPLIAITTIFMVIGLVVTYFCFDYKEDVREKLSEPLTDGNADDDDSMENA